jgi:hypothetical protein
MSELADLIRELTRSIKNLAARMGNPHREIFREGWVDGAAIKKTLNISERTLQTLRDNGTLPCSRIRGKFFYKVADLEKLLNENYCINKKK